MNAWKVHKFGGTSVLDAKRVLNAIRLLNLSVDPARIAVVVSAAGGITNALIEIIDKAKCKDKCYLQVLEAIRQRHQEIATELFVGHSDALVQFLAVLEHDVADLKDLLRAIYISGTYSELNLELISGYGELWMGRIFNAALICQGQASQFIDARNTLVVTHSLTGPLIDWTTSRVKLAALMAQSPTPRLVITGYVASLPDGTPTTLKRNGSDFSASIFAALLDAKELTIWTDVDGVYSADPKRVPEAVVLDELTYLEAAELAYFGAKVVHPHTMAPVISKGVPIWIKNSLNPRADGTCIQATRNPQAMSNRFQVAGFTTVDHVTILNLEGTGMIGVPGIAQRLFGSIRDVGVSVIMISQASSEQSICVVVKDAQAETAREAVSATFQLEIEAGKIQGVEVIRGCSILAAVGENMIRTRGVASRFFGALSRAHVNVLAIAQGSSERNISAVVATADSTRALRAVHAGFYLSNQTLSIGIIGTGLIGTELLKQIESQRGALKEQFHIDLRVRGTMKSAEMALYENRHDAQKAIASDLESFVAHIKADHLPHAVLVDCTASDELPEHYSQWLKDGIHVVTPNKKAGAGPLKRLSDIHASARSNTSQFFYSTTVGAGLPVIRTLQDLLRTGDRIITIEGILSGTLSFIFNSLTASDGLFSAIVKQAKDLGFTEPDPREDLSGMDVARKLVILAREIGSKIELADVSVENLVPEPLRSITGIESFLEQLPLYDSVITQRQAKAQKAGLVLRYVGRIDQDHRASVSLREYAADHPFARLKGSDNIVAFTTERYRTQPLIVQGPGAGPAVTAGGVFSDLLRLTAHLGAP